MLAGMENSNTLNKSFFFIDISFKLFWYLLLANFFNWRIYVFDTGRFFKLIEKMNNHQLIIRVIEQHHAFYNSHSIAIKLADKIVNQNSDDIVIKLARKLYKSVEIDLVFKKTLAKHLSLLTSINQYIVTNQAIGTPVLFINNSYRKLLLEAPEVLDSSIKVNYETYWKGFKLKLSWLLVAFAYLFHLSMQPFYKNKNISKKNKYAISIPFSWATKFRGAREFTFLVDDKIIKKDEVVFLLEYPESHQFYQQHSIAGFNLKEALTVRKFKDVLKKSTLRFNYDFPLVVRLLLARKKVFFAYEVLVTLLLSRMSWSIISAETSFENYIYFNKQGPFQIATNIFFKEKMVITHFYSQFIGGPYQISNNSVFDERNIIWSFLNPDYYYLNNQAMVDSMKIHNHGEVKYQSIGNIFSEIIAEFRKIPEYIKDIKFQYNIQKNQKVVGIFDTSYISVSKHYSNYNEAQYFLKDSIKLARSLPNCIFLFKPSKGEDFFLKGYWADSKGVEIISLRQKFDQLSNAIMLNNSADVADIVSISDVVYTNSFSSPTTDALLAGVPAFWYQAKTDVSFSDYNKIPGLVINDYEDLKVQVNEMLKDNYDIDIIDNLDFIHLIGDIKKKALTSLRLKLSNA
jgi:polysaccharide biosynthesis PFTS motif protein